MAAPTAAELPRVLCVDDEPHVLESLTLNLRRHFLISTAHSAAGALDLLATGITPAVVISDMRMPEMDGAALLKRISQLYPETTRILLTGEPSRDAAAAAINEGQIFRFLTKPCPSEEVRVAVEAGVIHHKMLTAEKRLMQETLLGCINALIDVLSMTNPVAFGRTNRVKRMATELSAALGVEGFWQLEAAAMLSQIGYISLPAELVEKLYYGQKLTPEETALSAGAPKVARTLLARIPRIEAVVQILASSQEQPGDSVAGGVLKQGADILRLVLAYDALVVAGNSVNVAIQTLRDRKPAYGEGLLDTFAQVMGARAGRQEVREILVAALMPGMIILDDLRTVVGTLLVPKGFEVSETFLQRTRNFDATLLQFKVRVMAATATPSKSLL
jgi:response regulator RpfG family c-di-GMP phosphodiesterase